MTDDIERERINHPDRFKTDDFVFAIDPRTGELEDPRSTAWRRESRGEDPSGISVESPEAVAEREESEAIARMNAEYEASQPQPEDSVGYRLRLQDPEFDAIRAAMALHCEQVGGEVLEEVNHNPKKFNELYDRMKAAAGGRLKSTRPVVPERTPLYGDVEDAPRGGGNRSELARLKEIVRTGATPREREEASVRYTELFMRRR